MEGLGAEAQLDDSDDLEMNSDDNDHSENQGGGMDGGSKRKKRRKEDRPRVFGTWTDEPGLEDLNEEDLKEALHQLGLADPQLGRGFDGWIMQKKTGKYVQTQVAKCPLQYERGCPFKVRAREQEDGTWKIQVCSLAHNHDHICVVPSRGIQKGVLLQLSPDSKRKVPKQLIAKVRGLGYEVNEEAGKKLRTMHNKFMQRIQRVANLDGEKGTQARIVSLLAGYTKEALIESGSFSEHCTYLLGSPEDCVVEIEGTEAGESSTSLVIPMSTENLLLNAWRQQVSPFPGYVMVDTTHRLIIEGLNVLLVGTQEPNQKFHIIAYAFMDYEDERAHFSAITRIRAAVESAVRERFERNRRV